MTARILQSICSRTSIGVAATSILAVYIGFTGFKSFQGAQTSSSIKPSVVVSPKSEIVNLMEPKIPFKRTNLSQHDETLNRSNEFLQKLLKISDLQQQSTIQDQLQEFTKIVNDLDELIKYFGSELIPYLQKNSIYDDCVVVMKYVEDLKTIHKQIPETMKILNKLANEEPKQASDYYKDVISGKLANIVTKLQNSVALISKTGLLSAL